jgi:thiamine-monophosphate kinase
MKIRPQLRDLGEDAVIRALTRKLPLGRDVRAGVGDDCAVIGSPAARNWTLLKTDAVVEGIHFDIRAEPRRVGWKAVCRAVSDIAAMGGTPQHGLVTLALCDRTPMTWVKELYQGIRAAAKRYGVSIVGGETSRSPGAAFINVALTGVVARGECIFRSGGSAGDLLYVTGSLGGSIAGKHLDFEPRLAQGQFLAKQIRPSAMMDISDGLGADLPRLAEASKCSFEVDPERIPTTEGCTLEQALNDGEDFELLFAIAPSKARELEKSWRRSFRKLPLTRIGALISLHKPSTDLYAHGYDHFASP